MKKRCVSAISGEFQKPGRTKPVQLDRQVQSFVERHRSRTVDDHGNPPGQGLVCRLVEPEAFLGQITGHDMNLFLAETVEFTTERGTQAIKHPRPEHIPFHSLLRAGTSGFGTHQQVNARNRVDAAQQLLDKSLGQKTCGSGNQQVPARKPFPYGTPPDCSMLGHRLVLKAETKNSFGQGAATPPIGVGTSRTPATASTTRSRRRSAERTDNSSGGMGSANRIRTVPGCSR